MNLFMNEPRKELQEFRARLKRPITSFGINTNKKNFGVAYVLEF